MKTFDFELFCRELSALLEKHDVEIGMQVDCLDEDNFGVYTKDMDWFVIEKHTLLVDGFSVSRAPLYQKTWRKK